MFFSRNFALVLVAYSLVALFPVHAGLTPDSLFSISIVPEHDTVPSEGVVRVYVTMKNTSDRVARVTLSTPVFNYGIHVTRSDDQRVRETDLLRKLKAMTKPAAMFRMMGADLQPGQKLSDIVEVNAYYDMGQPGSYLIQFSKRLPEQLGSGSVESNVVTVLIQ